MVELSVEIVKKKFFIGLFIGIHLCFIFLQIHKQSFLMGLSFKKQRNEKLKQELMNQKMHLMQKLYALQNKSSIKLFAEQELHMKKINVQQIKTL